MLKICPHSPPTLEACTEVKVTADNLPNPLPRPEGELEELERVWKQPTGWRIFSAVNNTWIGLAYIGTALLFSCCPCARAGDAYAARGARQHSP